MAIAEGKNYVKALIKIKIILFVGNSLYDIFENIAQMALKMILLCYMILKCTHEMVLQLKINCAKKNQLEPCQTKVTICIMLLGM